MAERRTIRRELAKWSKDILYLVGFEQVAEQLMGPDKFSKMTSTLSYLPPANSSTTTTNTTTTTTTTTSNEPAVAAAAAPLPPPPPPPPPALAAIAAPSSAVGLASSSPVSLVSNYTPSIGLVSLDEPLDLSLKKVSCVSSNNNNEPSSHSLLKKLINGSSPCSLSSSSSSPSSMSSSSPSANVTQSCQSSSPCDQSSLATLKTHLPPPAISGSDGLSSSSPSLRQPQESTNVDDSSTATSNSTSNDASNDVTAQIASLTPRRSRESTWKRTYTQEALDRALDDIVSGNLGTRRAAVIYGIPRSTLRNKVYKLDNQRGTFGPGRLPGRRPKNATTTGLSIVNASSSTTSSNISSSTSNNTSTGSTTLLARRSTLNGNLNSNCTVVTNTGSNDNNNNGLNAVAQHNSDGYLSSSPIASPPISLRNGVSRKPPSPKKSIGNCFQGTSPANPESNPLSLGNGSNLDGSLFVPNLNGPLDTNASINPLFMNPLFLAFLMNDSLAMALATQSLQQQQQQQQQQFQQQHMSSGNSPLNRDIYDGNLNTSQSSLLIQEYIQRLCSGGGGGGGSGGPGLTGGNGIGLGLGLAGAPSLGVASNGMDVDLNHTSGNESIFGHALYSTESDETGSVSSEPAIAPSNHKRRNTGSSTPNLENALRGRTVNRSAFASSLTSSRLERTCLPDLTDHCESNIASGNDTSSLSGVSGLIYNSPLNHHSFSQLPASTASMCSSVGTAGGDTTSTSSSPSNGNGNFNSTPCNNTAKIRPKRGRYRNYEREALDKAVAAVRSGEMTVHRAGTYFGVPHSTLEYKVKQRHLLRTSDSSEREKEREKDKDTLKDKESISLSSL